MLWRKIGFILAAGAALAALGCTPNALVKRMAAGPLDCPSEVIEADGYASITASGCGRRTTYLCGKQGCVHTGDVELDLPSLATYQARHDLGCSSELTATSAGQGRYRVQGCGRIARYRCRSITSERGECRLVDGRVAAQRRAR